MAYSASAVSCFVKDATVRDLVMAHRFIKLLKSNKVVFSFPWINGLQSASLVCFSTASFAKLELAPATFYQTFIFSPNDSTSKTIKKSFSFHQKSSFCSQDIPIFIFFPFFSTLFRFKRTHGSGITYDAMRLA